MSALRLFDGGDAPPPDAPQERAEINGFAAIPHAVCASPVSHLGYRVFGAILSFTRGSTTTNVTDSALAAMTGIGRKTASKAVAELVSLGIILKRSSGPHRSLTINTSPPVPCVPHSGHKMGKDDPISVPQRGRLCPPAGALVSPSGGACVPQRGHLLRTEKENSEKGPASSVGPQRGGAPPTPESKRGAPPQRAAPPPPASNPADDLVDPATLVWLESQTGAKGIGAMFARSAVANHRRALDHFHARGMVPPRPDRGASAEMFSYLARLGLPLPVDFAEMPTGDDRSEKRAGPGSLAKDAPGLA